MQRCVISLIGRDINGEIEAREHGVRVIISQVHRPNEESYLSSVVHRRQEERGVFSRDEGICSAPLNRDYRGHVFIVGVKHFRECVTH